MKNNKKHNKNFNGFFNLENILSITKETKYPQTCSGKEIIRKLRNCLNGIICPPFIKNEMKIQES